MKKNAGSVTVFVLLIFGACLTLSLCLLNGARYILACREIEGALDAALASTLADCDDDLADHYGIYAYAWQTAERETSPDAYFKANLGRHQGFLDMEVSAFSMAPATGKVLDEHVLLDQILRQMKYRAILETGKDILDMFGQTLSLDRLRQGLTEGQDQLDLLNEVVDPESGGTGEIELPQLSGLERRSFAEVLERIRTVAQGRTLSVSALSAADEVEDPGGTLEALKGLFTLELGMELMDYLNRFGQGISWALINIRDRVYLSQYIMDEFSYMTKSSPEGQYFERTEVEYILSGDPQEVNSACNIAVRLLFLRFALHAVYEFTAHYSGDPLVSLANALVEGYRKASQDVVQLYEGKKIPAIPGQSLAQLSYGDHLLLFLMIQNSETQIGRMASLIQANIHHWRQGEISRIGERGSLLIGAGQEVYVTGLVAQSSVSVRLWPFEVVIERERTMDYE
jgi:hypothetical protein